MKRIYMGLFLILLMNSCQKETNKSDKISVAEGVSDSLALYRAQALSDISYDLHFNLPGNRKEEIPAQVRLSFNFHPKANKGLQIDFNEDEKKLKHLIVNGDSVPINFDKEHLIVDRGILQEGNNQIDIEFIAGDGALNRRGNYLYTLFVPDRARTAFPVFDQPDLKANFKLSLTIPKKWKATANGKIKDSIIKEGRKTIDFATTAKLPTYLFSFAAGEFERATERYGDKEIELLYRETDTSKIEASIPKIFEQYKSYVDFYEDWTGINYPFQKHGMVAIPDFQFGGMEHPGAILLKSSTLFLPKEATQRQLNNRAQLLAHEVAHMWFGDLVTMKWFNDVWTKEVFANFMGDKATSDREEGDDSALKFLVDHFPSAYGVDRTPGANPIRQELHNLEDAGTMYGNIIYHKAPIMMQQLENMMGKDEFQTGIRNYLEKFSYTNATWPDLIKILNNNTSLDLYKWNEVWVNDPGRPVFDVEIDYKDGKINEFYLTQQPERGQDRVWIQSFDFDLHFKNGDVENKSISDSVSKQKVEDLIGLNKPEFIQYNPVGESYGVMPIDTVMVSKVYIIEDKVARASAYINLNENMLNRRYLSPEELYDLYKEGLKKEDEELNLQLLTDYLEQIYWVYLTPEKRQGLTESLENDLWAALKDEKSSHNQKILFKAYQNVFESEEAEKRLFSIWKNQDPPENIHLSTEDYMSLAFDLQLRSDHPNMLNQQYRRLTDADRQKRFNIIRPALSHDVEERDAFFNKLSDQENRSNEAAVLEALKYLHHPLFQKDSEKYFLKTLELLPEIQKTGDIFFPGRWLGASFGRYSSTTAYRVVQEFLGQNPDLNPKLKEKILQETDNLRRAQELRKEDN